MTANQNDEVFSILRTLVYYDIFDYPLSKREIVKQSCSNGLDDEKCSRALKYLVENNVIYKISGFYSLSTIP
ncbi:MAG: hypothetical protein R2764_02955 [Bacteroidales bacterium]